MAMINSMIPICEVGDQDNDKQSISNAKFANMCAQYWCANNGADSDRINHKIVARILVDKDYQKYQKANYYPHHNYYRYQRDNENRQRQPHSKKREIFCIQKNKIFLPRHIALVAMLFAMCVPLESFFLVNPVEAYFFHDDNCSDAPPIPVPRFGKRAAGSVAVLTNGIDEMGKNKQDLRQAMSSDNGGDESNRLSEIGDDDAAVRRIRRSNCYFGPVRRRTMRGRPLTHSKPRIATSPLATYLLHRNNVANSYDNQNSNNNHNFDNNRNRNNNIARQNNDESDDDRKKIENSLAKMYERLFFGKIFRDDDMRRSSNGDFDDNRNLPKSEKQNAAFENSIRSKRAKMVLL